MKDKRLIGLDALRIVAMLMVITQHYVDKGGGLASDPFEFTWYLSSILNIICYPSVLMFVLITGYFLSYKSDYSPWNRVLTIWKECWFYSIVISLLYMITISRFSAKELVISIFPISLRRWGFVNNYLLLILISPFLNALLDNISDKMLSRLILLLTIIQCIVPYIAMKDSFNTGYGNSIIWFAYLYILAYYIRNNRINEKFSTTKMILIAIVCHIITAISKFGIAFITSNYLGEVKYTGAFVGETPLLNVISAVALFCAFINLDVNNIFACKAISVFSKTAFSVYLVHEHPSFKGVLWSIIGARMVAEKSPFIQIVYWLACIIAIYCVISAFDIIRQKLFSFVERCFKRRTFSRN